MAQNPVPGWGRQTGVLDITDNRNELTAEQAIDRVQLIEAVNRYTWTYDERDMDAMAEIFADDAVFDGNVAGTFPIGPFEGRPAIAEWLQGHMDSQTDQRRHNAMNHIVTQQNETTAQVLATLLLTSAQDGQVRLVTTGFYRVDLVKNSGRWQISRIFGGFDAAF